MPRTYGLEAESPYSVAQILTAFGDEDYWHARLAAGDAGTATLDSLTVDDDDAVSVVTTFGLMRDRLPSLVASLGRGDLTIVHRETWRPSGDGRVDGEIAAQVPGVPLTARGSVVLSPVTTGSSFVLTGTVTMKVPVIGGAVERFIGAQLTNGFRDMHAFTTEWIARG